jgi:prephenate dehydrogenase
MGGVKPIVIDSATMVNGDLAATNEGGFRRVAIIGTGLIGGSFGLAVRREFPAAAVVGFDRPGVIERALARGAITEVAGDIAAAARSADLIFIALPVGSTIDALAKIAAVADANALVTDSGSTKALICREAQKHFRNGARFLGGHPMAGKETSGIEHADADLFRSSRYALIGGGHDSDERIEQFVGLLGSIGAEPVWCDAETHDWAVGIVSHLPQLASVALARVAADETDETGLPLSLAGPGLVDALRLAGSPYETWRDTCLTNRENIAHALDRLAQAIDHLRTHLADKELEKEFNAANEIYRALRPYKAKANSGE